METNITDETLQKHSSVAGTAQANFSASIAVFWLITYYLLQIVLMLFHVCLPFHFSIMATIFYL